MADTDKREEQSDPKRHKSEAEEEEEDDDDDVGGGLDYRLGFVNNPDDEGYDSQAEIDEIYERNEKIRKSPGFDADVLEKFYGPNHLLPVNLSNASFFNLLCRGAEYAITEHNRDKGTKYDFYTLINAMMNPGAGTTFYISFLAEDLGRIGEVGNLGPFCPGREAPPSVGEGGGPVIQLKARVFVRMPDEKGHCEMVLEEFLY